VDFLIYYWNYLKFIFNKLIFNKFIRTPSSNLYKKNILKKKSKMTTIPIKAIGVNSKAHYAHGELYKIN